MNWRVVMVTKPDVSKALAVEPPALPMVYPVGIYPLPMAIAGLLCLIGTGGFIGLRLADTAPWAVVTSAVGCWHLHEVMRRSPFSQMSYLTLSVFSALVA